MLCAREKEKGEFVCSSLPVDVVVRTAASAEGAVFVVEWSGDYGRPGTDGCTEAIFNQGTAFAYKDVGLITCDHVLRYSSTTPGECVETDFQCNNVAGASLTVINPTNGKSWKAKVIHRDKHHDLAIIRFDDPTPPAHRHFIGADAPISVSAKGVLIGFPNYSPGKRANFLNEMVLNRFPRSGLDRFEITGAGSIRQGNSGGPFVDEHFRIAGVAQQGAKQDGGNDECLCVTNLDKWLAAWKVALPAVVEPPAPTTLTSPTT
jgi:hypothetical protein